MTSRLENKLQGILVEIAKEPLVYELTSMEKKFFRKMKSLKEKDQDKYMRLYYEYTEIQNNKLYKKL